jgi:predicted deacylase
MPGRRKLTFITYLLAISIFLLTVSGDGPAIIGRFGSMQAEKAGTAEYKAVSSRTERTLMAGTPWETELYIISSPNDGPTVMVTGGIHGDEPAGYLAADEIATWAIDRGTLLVLPRANAPAIFSRTRNGPGEPDLNRIFPGDKNGLNSAKLASEILAVIDEFQPEWVIDLHEAENFELLSRGALGQTFIYPYNSVSEDIVFEMLTAVNRTIILEEYHFLLLRGMAGGSLIEAAQMRGADALIIETCIQMALSERIKFHRQVVSSLLYLLEIAVY